MEASLELAAGVLHGELLGQARLTFQEIERKLFWIFGIDDQRTIWALINIRLIYQSHRS